MSYQLEGSPLEVCDCKVLCPCWIGETADNGTCRGTLAHHYTSGRIDDIDVSGLTVAMMAFIPGKVLDGNWRVALFIDDRATEAQFQVLLSVYKGERGGPVADLAKLVGEVVAAQKAPIKLAAVDGKGTLSIGSEVYAEMEPYRGPTGEPTRLVETIFSTIPGSPAYVAKANTFRAKNARLGIDLDSAGHYTVQGQFSFRT